LSLRGFFIWIYDNAEFGAKAPLAGNLPHCRSFIIKFQFQNF
jgi:hypothetical protein